MATMVCAGLAAVGGRLRGRLGRSVEVGVGRLCAAERPGERPARASEPCRPWLQDRDQIHGWPDGRVGRR